MRSIEINMPPLGIPWILRALEVACWSNNHQKYSAPVSWMYTVFLCEATDNPPALSTYL